MQLIINDYYNVARRGAHLLDEVERSGARRLQMARAWPRAAQHKIVLFGVGFSA